MVKKEDVVVISIAVRGENISWSRCLPLPALWVVLITPYKVYIYIYIYGYKVLSLSLILSLQVVPLRAILANTF